LATAAHAQSVLQKSDWKEKRFESYLPAPCNAVPWLNIDSRTRLPKGDLPIGWRAANEPPFEWRLLPPPGTRLSLDESSVRGM
jgi:hypothetical protein